MNGVCPVCPHVSLQVEPLAKRFSTFRAAEGSLTDATLTITVTALRFQMLFSLLSGGW